MFICLSVNQRDKSRLFVPITALDDKNIHRGEGFRDSVPATLCLWGQSLGPRPCT
jgi:hypothetical protein